MSGGEIALFVPVFVIANIGGSMLGDLLVARWKAHRRG